MEHAPGTLPIIAFLNVKFKLGGGERVDDILPSKIAGSTWREGRMEDVSLKGKH